MLFTGLVGIIIAVLIIGVLMWLVSTVPFVDPQAKQVIRWLLLAVLVVYVSYFLLSLLTHGHRFLR